jgi:flagellar basal body-associated protein FliL
MRTKLGWLLWVVVASALATSCQKKPPVDIPHEGIVVNLSSETEGRRPLLRVDVTLQYDEKTAKDKEYKAKLTGAEAKAAILRALAELDPVEVITEDKAAAIENAAEAIKQKITEAGLPAPLDVKLTNFVIQG